MRFDRFNVHHFSTRRFFNGTKLELMRRQPRVRYLKQMSQKEVVLFLTMTVSTIICALLRFIEEILHILLLGPDFSIILPWVPLNSRALAQSQFFRASPHSNRCIVCEYRLKSR
ncbi:hypothetical protein TNCV_542101 [Trichonephila clavipes]|nr:hypothetical protein TNCV_542101 [Trichonephila clavipes]